MVGTSGAAASRHLGLAMFSFWRTNMPWFRNLYLCSECGGTWQDDWSATCDDDCPHCGARHMSPCDSDDLTYLIKEDDGEFVVLRSADDAEDSPRYQRVFRTNSKQTAQEWIDEQ
jgi:DNA-directed RNA polymerase subunit RPC12/RpoP